MCEDLFHRRKLKEGDLISCPNCELDLMRCLSAPCKGEVHYEDRFSYINFEEGGVTICPDCKTNFTITTKDFFGLPYIFAVWVKNKGWSI